MIPASAWIQWKSLSVTTKCQTSCSHLRIPDPGALSSMLRGVICHYSQDFKPAYIHFARNVTLALSAYHNNPPDVSFYAISDNAHPSLMDAMSIKRVPTLMIFGAGLPEDAPRNDSGAGLKVRNLLYAKWREEKYTSDAVWTALPMFLQNSSSSSPSFKFPLSSESMHQETQTQMGGKLSLSIAFLILLASSFALTGLLKMYSPKARQAKTSNFVHSEQVSWSDTELVSLQRHYDT